MFDARWLSAMELIIQTIVNEQAGSNEGYTYFFSRETTVPTGRHSGAHYLLADAHSFRHAAVERWTAWPEVRAQSQPV